MAPTAVREMAAVDGMSHRQRADEGRADEWTRRADDGRAHGRGGMGHGEDADGMEEQLVPELHVLPTSMERAQHAVSSWMMEEVVPMVKMVQHHVALSVVSMLPYAWLLA